MFFKFYWLVIREDIFSLISQAFSTDYFDPAVAETLIVLILKVDCPSTFKEFRPISLCNTIYKLITKVLVNRLRPMLDSIISPFQSSFIPKRGTCDNAIILQEISHMMHKSKRKKGDMAFKIDVQKAYNHVRWDILKGVWLILVFPKLL